ncbi:MAG: cation diffusion facilitator family transporter [Proteobacteria bacterium]|nr:cation diffusion facilitator family transporter [Pseudomonadota bacterium]
MTGAGQAAEGAGESLRTVLVALAVNALIASAKSVAAAISGSAAMLAEAAHSWVDAGNGIFLLLAERRAARAPTALHPMGFGRSAYVWAMVAGFGLFTAGAAVSVMHGIAALRAGPAAGAAQDTTLAYVVLAVAFVLESVSFLQARRQVAQAARSRGRQPWAFVLGTSQTTLRSIYLEDITALGGIVIAALALWLGERTGNPMYDAVGSILVGLLLGAVAIVLIVRNAQFLVGDPGTPEMRAALRDWLLQQRDVQRVGTMHIEFVGPGRVLVVAAVGLAGDPVASVLARRLRALEDELCRLQPAVARCLLTVGLPDGDEACAP